MRIIFLDIDGVMNSHVFYEKRYKRRWLKPITYYWWIKSRIKYVFNGFKYKAVSLANYKPPKNHESFEYLFKRLKDETDSTKWKWLSEYCNSTDTKICISSVWKRHFKDPQDWDKALQLLGFDYSIFCGITGARRKERGTEIKEWLDKTSIEKYAILDDDSDMLPEQMSNFFHIDGYYGISPHTIYRIDWHFKNK